MGSLVEPGGGIDEARRGAHSGKDNEGLAPVGAKLFERCESDRCYTWEPVILLVLSEDHQ